MNLWLKFFKVIGLKTLWLCVVFFSPPQTDAHTHTHTQHWTQTVVLRHDVLHHLQWILLLGKEWNNSSAVSMETKPYHRKMNVDLVKKNTVLTAWVDLSTDCSQNLDNEPLWTTAKSLQYREREWRLWNTEKININNNRAQKLLHLKITLLPRVMYKDFKIIHIFSKCHRTVTMVTSLFILFSVAENLF